MTLLYCSGANVSRSEAVAIAASNKLASDSAQEAARVKLGIASQDEITQIALRQLEQDRARGVIKNEQEMAEARAVAACRFATAFPCPTGQGRPAGAPCLTADLSRACQGAGCRERGDAGKPGSTSPTSRPRHTC